MYWVRTSGCNDSDIVVKPQMSEKKTLKRRRFVAIAVA